ncbi:MAG: mechanosensitive ion channel [Polyangiaceae bacterium]|nr:mechanosensitive ion channel [Polyangiaceae bacterium]
MAWPRARSRLTGSKRAFTKSAMDELLTMRESLSRLLDSFVRRLPFVLAGFVCLVIGMVISRLVRALVTRAGTRARLDPGFIGLIARVASAAVVLAALAVASVIVFPSLRWRDLIAGLGISSVAIGFALKDILQNFVAGVLLLWRRPFRIGDQIRTGDYEGTVEDIDVRATRIRTYDNELVVVPNGDVYTKGMIVRTAFGYRRVRLVVGISYFDNIDADREIIRNVLSRTEGVLSEPAPWIYVEKLAASNVELTVHFWAHAPQANVLLVLDRVASSIKKALDDAGAGAAFPRTVVHVEPLGQRVRAE